ncbi:transposase [Methanocaldococcus sp. 10A]
MDMKRKKLKESYYKEYEVMERYDDKDVLSLIKQAVFSIEPPYELKNDKTGRPGYNPRAIAVLIIFQRYLNLTDRAYIRYLKSNDWILKELDLDTCPSKSTICGKRNEINSEYFKKVNEKIISLIESEEKVYATDSTGLKLSKNLPSWSVKKKKGIYKISHTFGH